MKQSFRIMMMFCAAASLFALSGCGGGGGGGSQGAVVIDSAPTAANNSYSLTEDTYGLQNATFMSATKNGDTFIMRAAIADNITDPDFRTVFRIDVVRPQLISGPGTYAIGGEDSPVDILFFNGHSSTLLNTVTGTITFTSYGVNSGEMVTGSFAAIVEDHNSGDVQRPTYSVRGNFSFVVNTYGALIPTPVPVPAAAAGYYSAKCNPCHSLGNHDPISAGGAPDLALKGGEVPDYFSAGEPGHNGITLTAQEIHDLKILLNAN
jgi:hypothetical protein